MAEFFTVVKEGLESSRYKVHPEMRTSAQEIANRDEITLSHLNISCFIRKLYEDLDEINLMPHLGWDESVVGFFVSTMLFTGEHARCPLTQSHFDELKPKVAFVQNKKNKKQNITEKQ
jgi:hypothetical protein